MLDHRFPLIVAQCTGVVLAVAAASCSTTVHTEAIPPPPVRLRLDRAIVAVPQGTTYEAFATRQGLHARDGRLLSVTGGILERHISEGTIELNGLTPDPLHLLASGDRIEVVDGADRTEGTRRVATRLPGRANAFVQRTLATFRMREIATVGRRSGEVIDVRVQTKGRPRVPDAVALTFDDGPWPGDTEAVLRVLRRERVHATFFMVGTLIAERPQVVRAVIEAGHVVADHSFTHPTEPAFADLPPGRVEAEIAQAADALREAGARPTLFRPPGGSTDDEVELEAWRQHQRVVLWSVDPHDWDAARTPKQIARDVLRRVRPGSIVLLHDGGGDGDHTVAALPKIIRGIRKMGLDLVTLDPYRRRQSGDVHPRATVVYDDDCGFCRWSAQRLRAWDRRRALRFVTLRSAEAGGLLAPVPIDRRPLSWHLVTDDGRVWSAGAAVPQVLGLLPGGGPLAALAASMPGITEAAYAAVARRRSALGRLLGRRACAVDPSGAAPDGA